MKVVKNCQTVEYQRFEPSKLENKLPNCVFSMVFWKSGKINKLIAKGLKEKTAKLKNCQTIEYQRLNQTKLKSSLESGKHYRMAVWQFSKKKYTHKTERDNLKQ